MPPRGPRLVGRPRSRRWPGCSTTWPGREVGGGAGLGQLTVVGDRFGGRFEGSSRRPTPLEWVARLFNDLARSGRWAAGLAWASDGNGWRPQWPPGGPRRFDRRRSRGGPVVQRRGEVWEVGDRVVCNMGPLGLDPNSTVVLVSVTFAKPDRMDCANPSGVPDTWSKSKVSLSIRPSPRHPGPRRVRSSELRRACCSATALRQPCSPSAHLRSKIQSRR